MNLRNDRYLCKKFPFLFSDRRASMQNTAMCWGFQCGNGWYKIIKEAAAKLEPLIIDCLVKDPVNALYHPRASDIKEKYGTLRFYLSSGTDEMYAIVFAAEKKSTKVCEQCGQPGKMRGRNWYYVSCKKHVREEE